MRKIYLLPNLITAFALSCGLFVIFKMNMIPSKEVNMQILLPVVGILILAAFADLLDGAVARAMKAESDFGGFFDSLADSITFGVAPSVIVLKTLSIEPGTEFSFFLTTAALVYSVCGVLRLVRFNVMQMKEDVVVPEAGSKNFTGLPIPAAAAAAVSANLFLLSNEFSFLPALNEQTRVWIMSLVLVLLGYFMISRWKFPGLKKLRIRVASFQLVFLTVLTAVFIFYGLLSHFSLVFLILSWGYVIIAWILSIIRLISGRKSKTLEDFEPDPELDDEEE